MFVGAANRDKTEVCSRGGENQAQYEYRSIVIESVKLNVVERVPLCQGRSLSKSLSRRCNGTTRN